MATGQGLTLLSGPANAGKVALLLERYLGMLDSDPVLIVPYGSDVERIERELLARHGVLLSGEIGTFDDLFERLARDGGSRRPVVTDAQRQLIVRSAVSAASLNGFGRSARFGGFADALTGALSELESGLVDPGELEGDLARLYAAYRVELDRLELWDRDLVRRYAAERVAVELEAWAGRPVFAYGFEDLTGAEWGLLEALAGRTEVTVSLPYEPNRPVFESLRRTSEDLTALAGGRIEELPPRYAEVAPSALAHLERHLFAEQPPQEPELDGAIRFLEGAGARGTLELVGEELLELIRNGTAPEQILLICPSLDRQRAQLETALGALGVPYAIEGKLRIGKTAFGQALLSLLRFEWLRGGRHDLYGFLRSPFSGLSRAHVDYLEGRLRGRAVSEPERVVEETLKLRGQPLRMLDAFRETTDPVEAVRFLARSMLRAAYGLESPPVGDDAALDLRAQKAVAELLDELQSWLDLGGALTREELIAALERTTLRLGRGDEPGRVAVTDLLRARTRRTEIVFLLGLEEGSLPRRPQGSPFLAEEERRSIDERSRGSRLAKPDQVSRERFFFYTACTRPSRRLYLVREASTDDGSPREPSPFWDEVRALFASEDVARWTRKRPLAALTWRLDAAPTERERLRALSALGASDPDEALALARVNGWERRLERARAAFSRSTRLTDPVLLDELRGRSTFSVTELEGFADCSSIWFLERVIDPRTIDGEVDARLRGSVAHQTLFKFFSGVPKRLGVERVDSDRLEEALVFLRECLAEAIEGGVWIELGELQRRELEESLWRDLEHFVREETGSPLGLVPRRFEVSFGSDRSAPELQRGLQVDGFSLSGKIDRIDLDPFSARGIVQDYKSGKTAHSAAKIESELRLQIPLYMLVLRDLVGIEPLGGLYRALAGERHARGLLRAEAKEDVPGFSARDYLEEEEFWGQTERAKEHAARFVERIRTGDVQHDPKGGFPCPSWCELWSMCRVARS
ncbi:MAG TPA: PD-(D/E)XK nuclease family protein [Gaiellaceae bacterium]